MDYTLDPVPFTELCPPLPEGKLLAHQLALPKLPVPTLSVTLERLLRSLRAISTDDEFQRTRALVEDFGRAGGQGEELQRLLQQRAKDLNKSWLSDWWLHWAYVDYRDPIVLNVSYYFTYDRIPEVTQIERAAQIVHAVSTFKHLVDSQQKPCDMVGSQPLCMDMYKFMFNTCRIPLPVSDRMMICKNTHQHVLVCCKAQFFRVDVHDAEGRLFGLAEIQAVLQHIWDTTRDAPNDIPAVGLLTTENRDIWATERANLLKVSRRNEVSLHEIETAAYVVCLEEEGPRDLIDMNRRLWHADGRNRFFDKSMQFVVFADGSDGYIGEHTGMDGTAALGCVDYLCARSREYPRVYYPSKSIVGRPASDYSRPILFDLDTHMKAAISNAATHLKVLVREHSMSVVEFSHFGKDELKRIGVHPDAFSQMAFHATYHKLWNKMAPTYESAQTRRYAFGRTETARTATLEAKAFVEAFNAPAGSGVTPQAKFELLQIACQKHASLTKEASNAEGIDRHMLGLKLIAAEKNIALHPLFSDALYRRSSYWNMSTSNMTSEWFVAAFGAVVPDGYGICYCIRSNIMIYKVSSRLYRSDLFAQLLEETLLELHALCQQVHKK